jgi:glycosyltransferase involved in cell wall biosynthesis
MSAPLVVLDADVLGRQRTGDESYISALLAELPRQATGLRLAAVTRHPELVPAGVEPIELPARSQTLRMAIALPRLLRRLKPALVHFQHSISLACPAPSVLTVQDLSFERQPELMSLRDRIVFRTAVPWSVERAARVLVGSELTKRDLLARYAPPEEKVVITPYGADPLYRPEGPAAHASPYALFVGALQPRKDPVAAVEALALANTELRLVLVGPERGSGSEARDAAHRLGLDGRVEFAGHVGKDELARLYRGASLLVLPSHYEGFGLPVLEAMASGTPVVTTTAGALPEVAGDAAILVEPGDPVALAGGIERALADRERLVRAGLERARRYTWAETARKTLDVYRELL